ncbi:MAG TPA: hypothetical protein VKG44_03420, partial [Candidatus Baltobacteraceae bacterium]|nr:hypothetical protein [Candidatus Baltobacteraceae bacterium]
PAYGARPLKRTIQRELETPLGRRILAGEILEGMRVRVDYDADRSELTFSAEPAMNLEVGAGNGVSAKTKTTP